jgi:hypothetical protein
VKDNIGDTVAVASKGAMPGSEGGGRLPHDGTVIEAPPVAGDHYERKDGVAILSRDTEREKITYWDPGRRRYP